MMWWCRLFDQHLLLLAIITTIIMTLHWISQLLELNTVYLDGLEANISYIVLVLLVLLVSISNSLIRIHLTHRFHHDSNASSWTTDQSRVTAKSVRIECVCIHDRLR